MTGRHARGFTLMEVLAAVVFLAIVIPVAMQGISLATWVADSARRNAEAAELAQSKLEELQATREWQTGNLSGDFGEAHPEYRWTAELAPWEMGTLQQLHVHVVWSSAGRERQATVTTLVDAEAN
jgi:general secretion pathway protein I